MPLKTSLHPASAPKKYAMKTTYTTIDDYISSFPAEVQRKLWAIYKTIKDEVPTGTDTISYGMPAIIYKGKKLVYFAAMKQHLGFYPTPSGVAAFPEEIAAYQHSKGAIQFPLDQEPPLELIAKITRFRVAEVG